MSILKGFFEKERAEDSKFTPKANIPRSDTQSAVEYVMDNAENVGTVYAPTDAEYLTKALSSGLSNERVVTDTPTISWDWSETGKGSANWHHLGIEDLSDPGADRGLFWDDSEGAAKWFKLGGGLSFVGEYLSITDADLVAIKDASFQQGDVLYHDGTTLNRLPAGTSGYVLRTKGPGANPEWEVVEVEADLEAAEAAKLAAQQAQAAAEQAQSNAETAEDGAEAAQLAAEQAQGLAETAQQGAEQAQGLAETAQQAAELAETNAETAETNAETAQQAAENAQGLAEAAQSAAENAQSYAQEWANKAEDSLVSAAAGGDESDDYSALHWASKAAASAQAAGTAETNAEAAQGKAEDAQQAAEAAQGLAESAQSAAEQAQSGAENAQSYAEEWAINSEDDPVSSDAGGDGATTYSALHWATKAAASAQAAASSESDAETAETSAEAAQLAAENARDAALGAQGAAEDAQEYAEEWAINPEDSAVSFDAGGDGVTTYSALHWAAKSASSAQSAGTAKTNAETAESHAEAAQLAAEQAQSAAESAQSGAEDAQSYAMEWANNDEDDPVSVAAGGDNSTTFSALHWAAKAEAAAASVGDPVPKATFDANTILKADSDDTPVALTVGEGTLVGRASGGSISALNAATVRALLDLEVGTDVQAYSANLDDWSSIDPETPTFTDVTATDQLTGKKLVLDNGNQTNTLTAEIKCGNGAAGVNLTTYGSGNARLHLGNFTGARWALSSVNGGGLKFEVGGNLGGNSSMEAFPFSMDGTASGAYGALVGWRVGGDAPFLRAFNSSDDQTLEIGNGGSVAAFNDFTDASNYERGGFSWSSDVFKVGAEAAGTGTLRALDLIGSDLTFNGDQVLDENDIGVSVQAYSANLDSWSAVAPSSYTTTADLASTSSGKGASLIGIQDAGGLITAANVEAALAEIAADVAALDAAVVLKGTWDASAGSFPGSGSAQAGWSYIVSTGGTVDGVAFVENDRILAISDDASTSTYSGNWHKLDYTDQVLSVDGKTGAVDLSGDYQPLNSNLTSWSGEDPDDYYTKTEVDAAFQPLDADLTAWAAVNPSSYSTTAEIAAAYQPLDADLTAIAALSTQTYGRSLLTVANEAGFKQLVNLEIGTDVQAYSSNLDAWAALATNAKQDADADLTAIAALAKTDGNFIVGNGSTWVAESGATARSSLGLGSLATQAASSVTITGGSISGITDLAIADGGTGASTAVGARENFKIITLDQSTYDGLTPDSDTLYFITDAA